MLPILKRIVQEHAPLHLKMQTNMGSSAPEKVFFSLNIYIYIYLVELENMAPCQHLCRDVNNDMVGAIKVC
jgi:hypothetical protein